MATIRKFGKGWRAEVSRRGVRKSKVWPTKREATDWASRTEAELLDGAGRASGIRFGEVLQRYAREVSPTKRAERWESLRVTVLCRTELAEKRIRDITQEDIATYRDRRLREVTPGTVLREMGFLSAVFSQARKEWRLIDVNPCADVRRPPSPPARDRLVTPAELERLLHVGGEDLSLSTARAVHAFRFACETGMRAGEIVGLTPDCVNLVKRFVRLTATKNGTARDVPLSKAAVSMLETLPASDPVFDLTSARLDALWRKVRTKAGVDGLTFHDSRHYAITHLSTKLDVLALAKMVGHRDIRMLMTYYDASAEELAKRLD